MDPLVIKNYKILQTIGKGEFGDTYMCNSDKLDKKVVIKKIAILNNEVYLNNYKYEIIKLGKINHPNLIPIIDSFTEDDISTFFRVTEFAEGGDLQELIKKQDLNYFYEEEIIQYFYHICLGIREIHNANIIHRNIKSSNIYIGNDQVIKIGTHKYDFKIDYNSPAKAKKLLLYCSPEIINGEPHTFKSDIWSLGVVFYEMCSLVQPLAYLLGSDLSKKIKYEKLDELPSHFSSRLKSLINSLLNENPEKRPTIDQILDSKLFNIFKPKINPIDNQLFKVVSFKNGDKYIGEWGVNNKFNGFGKYYWNNGDCFRGYFSDSLRYGIGEMKLRNTNCYSGEFKNDVTFGYGIYIKNEKGESQGNQYEGEHSNGKKDGIGIYKWKRGDIYEGQYQNDMVQGIGTKYYSDKSKYEGEFKDSKRDGYGFLFQQDKLKYTGQFKDGLFHGIGIYNHSDGSRYEGEFKFGKKEGFGIKKEKQKILMKGKWKNDIFIN